MRRTLLTMALVAGCGGASPSGDMTPDQGSGPYPYAVVWIETQVNGGVRSSVAVANVGISTASRLPSLALGCTLALASTGPAPPNAHETHQFAGDITVQGGAQPETLKYDGDEYGFGASGVVWPDDAALDVRFAGSADVAAAELMVQMPRAVHITAPAPSGVSQPHDRDLALKWTAGSGVVSASVGNAAGDVDCHFDAAAAQGTIPGALLGQLGSGGATLYVAQENMTLQRIGMRSYRVEALTWPLGPADQEFPSSAPITLQ